VALPHEERFQILVVELKALQDRFIKYDDLAWKSRSWAIALVSAVLGWALKDGLRLQENHDLLFMATIIPLLFWLQEGLLRVNYVQKYAVRYRKLRSTLNDKNASIDDLSLYDLTNHIEGRPCWFSRLAPAFFRAEQFLFYLSLASAPLTLIWISHVGHCN